MNHLWILTYPLVCLFLLKRTLARYTLWRWQKNFKKKNRPSIKSHFRWCTGIEIAKFVWLMYHFLSHILTSNLNRIPIKWSICNESMTTRQKKIVSGSDKVWNNDGCAVYICLTKTRKKICKSPGHLRTYKKNYGQLLPLLLFLFIFNLNLFSWLASYDNSRFFYCCIELGPVHLWMRNGACQWNETIQSGFTLMCQDQSNTISTFHNSFNKIASILKWNVNNGTRAPFTEIDV